MTGSERRYDIDWLRVIAIGLLLIYHIGIAFQPWGVFIGFIQSDKALESLWIPMSMLNIWRIPLLFFVSGMGVCFAMRSRNWQKLIMERSRRILLPFVFGIFMIVPIHLLLWQIYYNQDISYVINQSHLWFLGNIFIYVILLSPVFYYLKRKKNSRAGAFVIKLFSGAAGLLLIVAAFVLEAVLINPESYESYATTLHGFLLGFLAFLFGYLCVYAGRSFWLLLGRWKWISLLLAIALFISRLLIFDLKAPGYLLAIESCLWIFSLFGIAFLYLNRPGKRLAYLSQAAYPVYIIHMIFLYLGCFLIIPLDMPTVLKFIVITIITALGCFGTYEFIIRRIKPIRILFGLKTKNSN